MQDHMSIKLCGNIGILFLKFTFSQPIIVHMTLWRARPQRHVWMM